MNTWKSKKNKNSRVKELKKKKIQISNPDLSHRIVLTSHFTASCFLMNYVFFVFVYFHKHVFSFDSALAFYDYASVGVNEATFQP